MLDLYAGSGAIGLEALSRGATSAVFVEHDRDAVRAIERNLDKLRLPGTVARGRTLVTALAQEAGAGTKYDLVLVDPPYGMYSTTSSHSSPAICRPCSRADGVVVVETDARSRARAAAAAAHVAASTAPRASRSSRRA